MIQAELSSSPRHDTWLGHFELCWPTGAPPQKLFELNATRSNGWTQHEGSTCRGPGELYSACLYWSVMTVTSIGYGDIYPTCMSEQLVAVAVMLMGSVLWGQVVATFCGVVATFNPEGAEFRRTMDDLNRFMHLHAFVHHRQPNRKPRANRFTWHSHGLCLAHRCSGAIAAHTVARVLPPE